ncbi:M48 family metallopeptidase [Rhodocyclus purpureus]|uniref:M48 family metallopeptidase n=1 Tax=Rhodocyclus purpureus TaxID=1067 RepID=UPI001912B8B3|nr:M48 family metallopeptidase [Rhodocyclus purpureus]MBK5914208.1 peptidase M48 [Rhodocyclus purpureus]
MQNTTLFAKPLPALLAGCLIGTALAATPCLAEDGVDVGKPSALRKLVPASQLEQQAAQQYAQLKRQAAEKGALAADDNPQLVRLRRIARQILPFAQRFNPQANNWQWEINLIGSDQLNAFCMPGGKIAFYTGIITQLKLTDDEIAVVMGHEIAHALREHARERMAKGQLTNIGAALLGEFIGGGKYSGAFRAGGDLMALKFSRDDESEADLVGLDLVARAGFDPRAGVSLWQKMSAANRGGPPAWLSTHPAGKDRIKEIERHLPDVMPLYQEARRS